MKFLAQVQKYENINCCENNKENKDKNKNKNQEKGKRKRSNDDDKIQLVTSLKDRRTETSKTRRNGKDLTLPWQEKLVFGSSSNFQEPLSLFTQLTIQTNASRKTITLRLLVEELAAKELKTMEKKLVKELKSLQKKQEKLFKKGEESDDSNTNKNKSY